MSARSELHAGDLARPLAAIEMIQIDAARDRHAADRGADEPRAADEENFHAVDSPLSDAWKAPTLVHGNWANESRARSECDSRLACIVAVLTPPAPARGCRGPW